MERVLIIKGDIVKSRTDAIVNAANTSLLGGGGVDGAIHRAAGPELLADCQALQGCNTGEAKITKGYKLKARYVIHTPGPIWRGGTRGEANLLRNCYQSCLNLAIENDIKTISFPSISTGVYRYPTKEAAEIALEEILSFLRIHEEIECVTIVCFDDETLHIYKQTIKRLEQPDL